MMLSRRVHSLLLRQWKRPSVASYHTDDVATIGTPADTNSEKYKENYVKMMGLVDDLKQVVSKIVQGGPEKARELHLRRKKMLPRDRINRLLDPGL